MPAHGRLGDYETRTKRSGQTMSNFFEYSFWEDIKAFFIFWLVNEIC
jgi:hypothetical protein